MLHSTKIAVTKASQPCRHCGTAVIEKTHKPDWKPKPKQPYYFRRWLQCPKKRCKAMYLLEDEKVILIPSTPREIRGESPEHLFDRWMDKD